MDHKAVKNDGNKPQYRQRDHHEGIISRDDFFAAQQLLAHSMTGRTGMLPHLHVIDKGPLKGFVVVNPRWAGFDAAEYIKAASSVSKKDTADDPVVLEKGTLDLRGFSVVRGQFFESPNKCTVKLSYEKINFVSLANTSEFFSCCSSDISCRSTRLCRSSRSRSASCRPFIP